MLITLPNRIKNPDSRGETSKVLPDSHSRTQNLPTTRVAKLTRQLNQLHVAPCLKRKRMNVALKVYAFIVALTIISWPPAPVFLPNVANK